jgi:glycine cleavage system H protein
LNVLSIRSFRTQGEIIMPVVRGCELPDELLYDVPNNMWYREEADGTVTLGMTAVALALAGQLVAVTPRKAGRSVQAGKSCATIESGKWVGPAKIAFDGEVVAVNDDLVANPKLANADPYGAGWLLRVKPADWAAAKATLTPGSQVAAPYEAKMSA